MRSKTLIAAAIATTTLLAACGGNDAGDSTAPDGSASGKASYKMTFGDYSDSIFPLPVYVAIDEGLLTKNGIDLKLIAAAAPAQIQGLTTGDLDAVLYTGEAPLQDLNKPGAPNLKMILNELNENMFSLYGTKTALAKCPQASAGFPENMKCLKDQEVGVAAVGGRADGMLYYLLSKAGLTKKDVKVIAVGTSANALPAIKTGKLKYYFGGWSARVPLVDVQKLSDIMVEMKDLDPALKDMPGEVFLAKKENLDAKPGMYKAFVKAMGEAMAIINDPSQEATVVKVLKNHTKLDDATITAYAKLAQEKFTPNLSCESIKNIYKELELIGQPESPEASCDTIVWADIPAEFYKK